MKSLASRVLENVKATKGGGGSSLSEAVSIEKDGFTSFPFEKQKMEHREYVYALDSFNNTWKKFYKYVNEVKKGNLPIESLMNQCKSINNIVKHLDNILLSISEDNYDSFSKEWNYL